MFGVFNICFRFSRCFLDRITMPFDQVLLLSPVNPWIKNFLNLVLWMIIYFNWQCKRCRSACPDSCEHRALWVEVQADKLMALQWAVVVKSREFVRTNGVYNFGFIVYITNTYTPLSLLSLGEHTIMMACVELLQRSRARSAHHVSWTNLRLFSSAPTSSGGLYQTKTLVPKIQQLCLNCAVQISLLSILDCKAHSGKGVSLQFVYYDAIYPVTLTVLTDSVGRCFSGR